MTKFHIGCSGFHYKHWKGSFYPDKLPQTKWFEYYCQHFDTLELNVTFYRFPQLSVLQKWYVSSPANFLFSVKAPRVITHFKKFNGTERMLDDFYHTVEEGLKDKCGCCLFQLPPNYTYTEQKLENIIHSLDRTMPNVLEFRHESWWRQDVIDILGKEKISFCGMSHPSLPKDIICNNSMFYYRFHGEEQLYSSRYSMEALKAFRDNLIGEDNIKQAFIFFNNDINTNAVYNAKQLHELLLDKSN